MSRVQPSGPATGAGSASTSIVASISVPTDAVFGRSTVVPLVLVLTERNWGALREERPAPPPPDVGEGVAVGVGFADGVGVGVMLGVGVGVGVVAGGAAA